ncbi:MAG: GAF domain-containing protein [Ardenticatenales bacterium]|nr:GAF domain-containing protein [Ardenticatenales bacterium]
MPSWLRRLLTAPAVDEEQAATTFFLNTILLVLLGVSLITTPLRAFLSSGEMFFLTITIGIAGTLVPLALLFLMRRGHIRLASVLLAILLWGLVTFTVVQFGGLRSDSTVGYRLVLVVAALLLGGWVVLAFTGLILLTTFGIFYAEHIALIKGEVPTTLLDWSIYATIFALLGALLYLAATQISKSLNMSLAQVHQNERARAESQQALLARTRALTASAEVSRRLSSILNQEQLVHEVVEQVRAAFSYYHVQIYLYDSERTELRLVGGTGKTGQTMLAKGHSIAQGQGLVGRAAETNGVVLVPDVSIAQEWLSHPLLPETRTEAAVPITLGGRVLGVLDVQHTQVNSLTEDDVGLLQSIADQVAVALQNTQLYEQAQRQAEREARVLQISQKIQYATSVESALRIAVRELGETLGSPASVHLTLPPLEQPASQSTTQEE